MVEHSRGGNSDHPFELVDVLQVRIEPPVPDILLEDQWQTIMDGHVVIGGRREDRARRDPVLAIRRVGVKVGVVQARERHRLAVASSEHVRLLVLRISTVPLEE